MKAVVSDSTSLIILQKMKKMELLSNVFEEIYITPEVMSEVSFEHLPKYIKIKEPKHRDEVLLLELTLDAGESSSIVLAKEEGLMLIIDEKKGRKVAESYGVGVIGFLGILALNVKEQKLSRSDAINTINEAKQIGLYISESLLKLFSEKISKGVFG